MYDLLTDTDDPLGTQCVICAYFVWELDGLFNSNIWIAISMPFSCVKLLVGMNYTGIKTLFAVSISIREE